MRQDNSIGWHYNERYIHIRDIVAEIKRILVRKLEDH